MKILHTSDWHVGKLLRGRSRIPEHRAVLGEMEPLGGIASVEKIAANAVMAGCLPEHFPVVLAAVQAILDPEFNLRGVQTTDENVAPLLIVNGPAARRLGVNAGWGALGPGWTAYIDSGSAFCTSADSRKSTNACAPLTFAAPVSTPAYST